MIEEPIELPPGWTLAHLGDVACLRKEPVNPKEKPGNRFNYLSIGNVESNTGNLVNFKPTLGKDINSLKLAFTKDDVLYSKLRPYLNKVLMPEFDGISATDLIPITPNKSIEKKYLGYYLRTRRVVGYANQRLRGIQLPRLATKDLLALTVPVAPLAEQRRIVAKIETLFSESKTVRESLDKVPVLLRRFHQSVLAKAFSGELTQRDPNDEPAQRLLDRIGQGQKKGRQETIEENERLKLDLAELPETWVWTTMNAVFQVTSGGTPRRNKPEYWNGSIPWVTSGEVAFGDVTGTREHITEEGLENSSAKLCPPGTILLALYG